MKGPGQRHLEGPRRPGARVLELLDHAQAPGRGDGLEHLEAVLLVVPARTQPAPRLASGATPGEVPIELGREEAHAAHLAVGHDVDAGLLLVAQGQVHGVVLDLADVGRSQLTRGRRRPRPGRARPGWACEPQTEVERALGW